MNEKELSVLDGVLGRQLFVSGSTVSQADAVVYSSLVDKLPITPTNVVRWAQHMAALSTQQMLALPPCKNSSGDTQLDGELSALLQRASLIQQCSKVKHSTAATTAIAAATATATATATAAAAATAAATQNKGNKSNCNAPSKSCSKSEGGSSSKGGKLILKTAKGTRDYHPAEMAVRRTVFDTIKSVFHMHGAVEIETPVFELKEVLTGKYGEDSKLIYDLEDQGGEMLSLRYDLTVPFARYVAQNKIDNISRYHIARVYRRDSPAMTRGRYREFYQCDFDIAGSYGPMVADGECVQVVNQVLTGLDLGSFTIKVNHRKLLDGLFGACGVPSDKFRPICSAVDKLDKSSWCEVRKEMVSEKGLDEAVADLIGEYVKLNGKQDMLDTLKNDPRLQGNADVQAGIQDLEMLLEYTNLLQCDANLSLDMSLARGLDYYTGIIYEAVLHDTLESAATDTKSSKKSRKDDDDESGTVGSVAGGGRYDNLVGMFDAKHRSVPCVGVSFGIERLFAIKERKMRLEKGMLRSTLTNVYVAGVCKGMFQHRLQLVAMLHSAGINTETSRKINPKFLTQLQYAEDTGIPVVVSVGDSEVEAGQVNVRDTVTRKETKVPRDQLLQHLQQLIKQSL